MWPGLVGLVWKYRGSVVNGVRYNRILLYRVFFVVVLQWNPLPQSLSTVLSVLWHSSLLFCFLYFLLKLLVCSLYIWFVENYCIINADCARQDNQGRNIKLNQFRGYMDTASCRVLIKSWILQTFVSTEDIWYIYLPLWEWGGKHYMIEPDKITNFRVSPTFHVNAHIRV